jgi:hypothetical protein
MSSQRAIDARELAAIEAWLDRSGEGAGNALVQWADARDIELAAVVRIANRQADSILAELRRGVVFGSPGCGPRLGTVEALAGAMILGFQLGVDAERRRRDGAELPS